jgi:hypothetical protein
LGSREKNFSDGLALYYRLPLFEHANRRLQRLSAQGFDAAFEAQVDAFLADI